MSRPSDGGRIDQDEVEPIAQRGQQVAKPPLPIGQRDELDFRARQVPVRGNQPQVLDTRFQRKRRRILNRLRRRQGLIDGAGGGGLPFQAEPAREVPLRVHVHHEDPLLGEGQSRR